MNFISLARHADSTPSHIARVEDIDRPLSAFGITQTIAFSKKMCAKRVEPDIFYVSPAQRSIHTAMILIRELQLSYDRIRIVKNLYNASEYELLDFYEHEVEQEKHCMIIGHNPGISNFASLLSGESYSYPTMGCVTLAQKIEVNQTQEDVKNTTRQLENGFEQRFACLS
ncbi:MAG: SixA phosphatase family protein [Chitinophagales bacterium]